MFLCVLNSKGKNAPATVPGKTAAERLHNAWLKLQSDVNCYIDSDLDKVSTIKFAGIRQVSNSDRFLVYHARKGSLFSFFLLLRLNSVIQKNVSKICRSLKGWYK